MNTYEIISVITASLALIGSGISLYISIKENLTKIRLSLYSDYTKRYQEIKIGLLNEDKKTWTKYYRLYIDLCSEEYHLNKKKCWDDDVWKMWQDGMRLNVKIKDLQTVWRECSQLYNDDFNEFFSRMIR